MDEEKKVWQLRFSEGRGRDHWWGSILVALGGFWLLGNRDIVPEPVRIVLPSLVILWGIATLFTRQSKK